MGTGKKGPFFALQEVEEDKEEEEEEEDLERLKEEVRIHGPLVHVCPARPVGHDDQVLHHQRPKHQDAGRQERRAGLHKGVRRPR